MNLSSIFYAILVASICVDSSHGAKRGVQVMKNVLDAHECEEFAGQASSSKQVDSLGPKNLQGFSDLSLDLARRMYQAMQPYYGGCKCSSVDAIDDKMKVATSIITETTSIHKDHHCNGNLAAEKVGFVVLNSNPEATFVYGDNEDEKQERVPIQQGSLVTFWGDVAHHTIIGSGKVHLLGPFSMSSFLPVGGNGGGDDDDDDDDDGGDDNCQDCADCGESGFVCTCLEPSSGDDDDDDDNEDDVFCSICSAKGGKGGDRCSAFDGDLSDSDCDVGGDDDDDDNNGCDSCASCPNQEFSCECNTKSKSSIRRDLSADNDLTRDLSTKLSKSACRAVAGEGATGKKGDDDDRDECFEDDDRRQLVTMK